MKTTIALWVVFAAMAAVLSKDMHQFLKFFGITALMFAMLMTPFVVGKLLLMFEKKTGLIKAALSFVWVAVLVIAGIIFIASAFDSGGGGLDDLPNTRPR